MTEQRRNGTGPGTLSVDIGGTGLKAAVLDPDGTCPT